MERPGLAGLLAIALALAACDGSRARPDPFSLEAQDVSLAIVTPATGSTVVRRLVVSPGVITRIEGRSLPVPSRIELRAHAGEEPEPFFLSNLDVRTDELQAEYLVRGGPGQLQTAATVRIVGSLLTPSGTLIARTHVVVSVH